jgi:hypothetical protein
MAKWKLFGRSKEEEIVLTAEKEDIVEEDKPLAEYKETLQTGKATTKKTSETATDQHVWRDVDKIEKDIDTIHLKKAKKPKTDIEKTVDELIEKRKK